MSENRADRRVDHQVLIVGAGVARAPVFAGLPHVIGALGPDATTEMIDAIVRAVDPRLHAEVVSEDGAALTVRISAGAEDREDFSEVRMTRFSTRASFVFTEHSTTGPVLPLMPAGG